MDEPRPPLPATAAVAAAAAAMDADALPDYAPAQAGEGGPLLTAPDLEPSARRSKKARPGGAGDGGGGGGGAASAGAAAAPVPPGGLPGGLDGDADDMVRVVPVPKDSVLLREDVWRPVRMCPLDKAAQLTLSPDRMEVAGSGGYASARASHGVAAGCYYWEATVLALPPGGGVRLGWSTRRAELQAPVGYDAQGFGLRAASGEKVHCASRRPYGPAWARPGAVVGVYLYLPPGGRPLERGRGDVVMWKGEPYLVDRPEAPAKSLLGSAVGFSVDGAFQGVAYADVPEGTYYPTASLFTPPGAAPPARVRLNFGPVFAHPPVVLGPGMETGWCGVRGREGGREGDAGAGGGSSGGGGGGVRAGPRLPRPLPACELAGDPPEKKV